MKAPSSITHVLAAMLALGPVTDRAAAAPFHHFQYYGELQESCTANTAQSVAIRAITTDPETFHRRCVALEGVYYPVSEVHSELAEGILALYAADGPPLARAHGAGVLSLYSMTEFRGSRAARDRFHHVTLFGLAFSCAGFEADLKSERERQHGPDSAGTFYFDDIETPCFDGSEVFVEVLGLTAGEKDIAHRLTIEDLTQAAGDLTPMETSAPGFARLKDLADRFFAAIAAQDQAALERMITRQWMGTHPGGIAKFLATAPETAFAPLWGKLAGRQQILLAYRHRARHWGPQFFTAEAVACTCTLDDCQTLWPISVRDIEADPARPYACVILEAESDHVSNVQVMAWPLGLAEPPRTGSP